ncbi:hypothetical protein I4U23_005956 [Adineta vaga]|nr:hypothetical protein I4U23_005956 [Adineta vaga]
MTELKKNNSSDYLYGWFDVSNNFDNERHWSHKYIEFNQRKCTLTFHSNECIRPTNNEIKQITTLDLNCDNNSISSSSSTSSLYKSNDRRSSFNTLQQSNSILPTLLERISPSLSKTILSPIILTDDKIVTSYPTSITDLSSDRSSVTNTSRQSRIRFSHLFGRSSHHTDHFLPSLKRAKSATKLERQKHPIITHNQHLFPNIPSVRSQSHESLFVSNGPLGSTLLSEPIEIMLNNCHIRRLHPSILPSSDLNNNIAVTYIEIRNKNENKTCYLRTKENSLLLKRLQCSSSKHSMDDSRIDNSLDIWILEAKGLPTKKKYSIKIFLDDDIYGKTASIERRDELFWGENFIFKDLSEGYSYIRMNYLRLIELLESNISLKDKDEIATSLTRIAHSLSYAIPYLVDIIQAEICSTCDNSLTFRGNSIATKSMESYMKLVGKSYLHETLIHFITDIISSKNLNDIDLEVDPDRLMNINNLEKNQSTLKLLCEQIWFEIQKSQVVFP